MSAAIEKAKRIEAETVVRIAHAALERIAQGHSGNPQQDAWDALDKMFKAGKKQPLQALVGHVRT